MMSEYPPVVALRMMYHFSASFGVIVTVQFPPGEPVNVTTLLRPFELAPSVIARE